MKKLDLEEIASRVPHLAGWSVDQEKLFREFNFADFPRAFGFMSSVAIICQEMNHHPEWTNVYTNLKVWLSSHEVDGISDRDFELAERMNALFAPR